MWCQWEWELHPNSDAGIAAEQHRPDLTLAIRHFSYLSPETEESLKVKTTKYRGASALILIFTSFSTCRFCLIKHGGFGFFPDQIHYFIASFSHRALSCWYSGRQARTHHRFFWRWKTHKRISQESHVVLRLTTCFTPCLGAGANAGAACLTVQQALRAAGQWPPQALACPWRSQTHRGSSSSSLSPATFEFVRRLPTTQQLKQQWHFGGTLETTTEVALEVDHTVESG